MEWYYGYVAGIRQSPGRVGWKDILIAPNPGPLTSADASFQSPAGSIVSRWRIEDGRFRLETEVPAGVTARAILPDGTQHRLSSGKRTLECAAKQWER